MKKNLLIAFFLLNLFQLTAIAGGGDNNNSKTGNNNDGNSKNTTVVTSTSTPAKEDGKIKWLSLPEAETLMKTKPRYILVDIYTNWCGWCKRLDQVTFQNPDIIEYINDNYYAVKLNAETKESIVVGGKEYKYLTQGNRGMNELAIALTNGQVSMPTLVVLGKDFAQQGIIPGYQEPEAMDKILHYFAGGFYEKNINWGIFEKSYKSRIKK